MPLYISYLINEEVKRKSQKLLTIIFSKYNCNILPDNSFERLMTQYKIKVQYSTALCYFYSFSSEVHIDMKLKTTELQIIYYN